ncbi:flavodoxin [Brachyspira aalborgi]|uniref:Flavodoxin n=1 Tax=Brachyspira aalborgi TaxID=29522 RepID=A0AB38Q1E6_9SPIR|nr:flavodoxin [Brachyspira aalborgi]TXJ26177.1 flavodoxin [Brachyspira aalborgi]
MTKRIIIFLTSLIFFTGAFLNAQNSKTLIVYFSWGGNTRVAAENTKRLTGADIFEITVKNPYPTDYSQCVNQAREEQRTDFLPELNGNVNNLSQYDTIIVAFPNWWGTYPQAVKKFLIDNRDISSKKIALLCTHGGSRLGRSVNDLKALYPNANILEGLAISGSSVRNSENDIRNWLKKIGLL